MPDQEMTTFGRPYLHEPRTADDPRAALRVTVEDLESGDNAEEIVLKGDYLLITSEPCGVDGIQSYRSGRTHVITVKDRTP